MTDEKELGIALKNKKECIEIEGDLAKKVIKIKATGKVAWGVCIGAIALIVANTITTLASGGASTPITAPLIMAAAPAAVSIWGVSVTVSAVLIAIAGGSINVLKELKDYQMEKIADNRIVLRKK